MQFLAKFKRIVEMAQSYLNFEKTVFQWLHLLLCDTIIVASASVLNSGSTHRQSIAVNKVQETVSLL